MGMITKNDKLLFFTWPIVASVIALATNANFFWGTVLYLIVPGIYLSFRNPKLIGKSAIVTAVTMPIWIIFEYLAVTTETWYFATSIFPFRIFNDVVTIDVIIWYFAWVYLIVMYYEFFLDKHVTVKLYHHRLKYSLIVFSSIFLLFLVLLQFQLVPKIPYLYLIFGLIIGGLPTVLALLKTPKLLAKIAKATLYFVFLFLAWELVALTLGHWSFPGTGNTFIGWIEILGLRFPLEELLVWMILGTTGMLSWFEFFDDDLK